MSGTAEQRWAQLTAEAARLVRLGANTLTEYEGHHIVLTDPEGNEFCVAAAKPAR